MSKRERSDQKAVDRLLSPEAAYDMAAPYYDKWAWQRIWRTVERRSVRSALNSVNPSASILDIGCGTGSVLNIAQQSLAQSSNLVGIDISYKMLSLARQRLCYDNVRLIHKDFFECEFKDKSFDIVFMCRVATHIRDISELFRRVGQLLRDGGIFVFSSVDARHKYDVTRVPFGAERISIATYKHALECVKLEINRNNLQILSLEQFTIDNISDHLMLAPDFPRSLAQQTLAEHQKTPFGYVITCALPKKGDQKQRKSLRHQLRLQTSGLDAEPAGSLLT